MTRTALALVLAVALVPAACLSTSQRAQDKAADAQLARIDTARSAWMNSNGPRQAVDYARAVHEALAAGAYNAQPYRWGTDLPESIKALDLAAPAAGPDAAQLVAWRAVLLADNAQPAEALAEYERSLAIGPTYIAASALAAHHGRSGRIDAVHTVCGGTAPKLAHAERFDLMAACHQASNALTEEAGLPWASAEELAWFRAERERRAQVAVAQAEAARQREQDDVRARRDQMLVDRMCRDECAETASRCDADCGSVAYEACSYGCESREKQCLQACK